MSTVRNREASVSRRLTMYYSGSDFNLCHGLCPLYGGCPPLGGSVMGGSTVIRVPCIRGVIKCYHGNH